MLTVRFQRRAESWCGYTPASTVSRKESCPPKTNSLSILCSRTNGPASLLKDKKTSSSTTCPCGSRFRRFINSHAECRTPHPKIPFQSVTSHFKLRTPWPSIIRVQR